jgi:hypothetical protein
MSFMLVGNVVAVVPDPAAPVPHRPAEARTWLVVEACGRDFAVALAEEAGASIAPGSLEPGRAVRIVGELRPGPNGPQLVAHVVTLCSPR